MSSLNTRINSLNTRINIPSKPSRSFSMIIVLTFTKIGIYIGLSILTFYLLNKYYYDQSTSYYIGTCLFELDYRNCTKNPNHSYSKYWGVYGLTVILPFIALLLIEVFIFNK